MFSHAWQWLMFFLARKTLPAFPRFMQQQLHVFFRALGTGCIIFRDFAVFSGL